MTLFDLNSNRIRNGQMKLTKKMPNFYGSIVLMFPKNVTQSQISDLFGKDNSIQMFDDMLEMTYKEVKDYCCWEVNELLTQLFQLCDFKIISIAQKELNAKILIDISFHHYDDMFPALLFDGEKMEYIHMMKADISIDAY